MLFSEDHSMSKDTKSLYSSPRPIRASKERVSYTIDLLGIIGLTKSKTTAFIMRRQEDVFQSENKQLKLLFPQDTWKNQKVHVVISIQQQNPCICRVAVKGSSVICRSFREWFTSLWGPSSASPLLQASFCDWEHQMSLGLGDNMVVTSSINAGCLWPTLCCCKWCIQNANWSPQKISEGHRISLPIQAVFPPVEASSHQL